MQCREQVFKYPNATVRVHTPDLSEFEKEKRTKELKRSAELVLKEVLKNEYNERRTNS